MMSQVIHVITGLGVGGAEMVLYNLLSGFSHDERQRHLVVCLGANDKMGDKITALGVKVECLNMPKGRPTFKGLLQLTAIIRAYKKPVIQGWLYHGNLAASCAVLLAFKTNRLYWSIHNSLTRIESEKPLTRRIIYLLGFLSFLPRKIIYVAKLSATQHEEIGYLKSRTVLIPNGYDTDIFKPNFDAKMKLRSALNIPDDMRIIGVVGRWDWTKDHANFISALALVDGAHGVLVGTDIDDNNKELMELLTAEKVRDRVHLLGYRDDVPELMSAFDILCLSSRAEALPNVVGEAMACGVPCVVTNVGDVAELVADTGWVCPAGDYNSLAACLKEALMSDLSEYSRKARQRVSDYFSYAEMLNTYKKLYETRD